VLALWQSVDSQTQTGPAPGGAALTYLLNQSGIYLGKIGDQAGHVTFMQASLTLKQARLPADHRDIAVGLANLGVAQIKQGAFDQAEALLAQAVAHCRDHRPDSADLADSLDLSGFVRTARVRAGQGGDLAEARDWREEALALYKQHFGPRHNRAAQALNNLGLVHSQMGDPGAAATYLAQSLEINREVLPPGDARLAYGCLNVGTLRLKAGQARQAEDLLREAYDLWNALLPSDHPELRNAAGWLTSCYLVLARLPGAKGLYEAKAKAICDRHGLDLATQQAFADTLPLTMEAE
jgi:Tfp pilus assembly protein PilF